MNRSYLQVDRTATGDEWYTPSVAVEPLVKYLKQRQFQTVWCPFDTKDSQYVKVLTNNGFKVIYTHQFVNNGNFFTIEPPTDYDIIISNPPYSVKDKVLDRCYKLNKPFALLLPLPTLQSVNRYHLFKNGLELLIFDRRINFFNHDRATNHKICFATIYFCRNFLPEQLIFEQLTEIKP